MRRKDREMPEVFALEVADRCAFASLATVNADGTPYCVPVSIVRDGMRVYFHCAPEGQKTDNLRRSPCVCLSCVGNVSVPEGAFSVIYESAVLVGSARELSDEVEKIRALRLLSERHTPDNMARFDGEIARSLHATAVWEIRVDTATGKRRAP